MNWLTSARWALALLVPLGVAGGLTFAWGSTFPVDTTWLGLALVWPGVTVAASGAPDRLGAAWWGMAIAAEWLWFTILVRAVLALRALGSRHDAPAA